MKKIKQFIVFLWNYKKLTKIHLSNYGMFKIGDNLLFYTGGKQFKIIWKYKNKIWIK